MSEAIELGWADAIVTATDIVQVGKEGNEQEVVCIEVAFPECGNQTLAGNFFFTEKSLDWTFDILDACGWSPEENEWDLTQIDKGRETPCAGTAVRVEVTEDERDGKYYKGLNKIVKPGAGRKKATEEGRKSLVARIKGHVRDANRFDKTAATPGVNKAIEAEDTPY